MKVLFFLLLITSLLISLLTFSPLDWILPTAESSFCSDETMAKLGGVRESQGTANSAEIDGLARFAVDEHNKKENAMLEFVKVVKAKEQVVAGTLHHLTIEAIEAGNKKIYEAKVWVKPWLHFKELQEFKHAADGDSNPLPPSFTSSDLGVKREGHGTGWKEVPAHDPAVQDAAHHAVKILQQRSNCLSSYELQEIAHAKAEVVDDAAKFDMLLKVKRGGTEEKFKVELHKSNEGTFLVKQVELHD